MSFSQLRKAKLSLLIGFALTNFHPCIIFVVKIQVTFEVREEAVGIGQPDSVAKYGIGESVGRSGEVLEDDYGIAVKPESFVDIVTGVDPSKFAGGSGRIGEEVLRRGLGFGADGRPVISSTVPSGESVSIICFELTNIVHNFSCGYDILIVNTLH